METRLLSTIINDTNVLISFEFNNKCFDVRKLSFRESNPLFIITSKDINENIINLMKVAPIAELILTSSKTLRFSCRPSVNYPEFKLCESDFLQLIKALLKEINVIN
jgi:hypothetical protein